MTSPAITIGPDTTIPAAARLMNTDHISRLPVVDEDGKLVGIVSRRDLLSVFLRSDAEIAHDARQVLDELPLADAKAVIAEVKHGVVTLTGTIRPGADHEQDPDAARAAADLGHRRRGRRREPARPVSARTRKGRVKRPFCFCARRYGTEVLIRVVTSGRDAGPGAVGRLRGNSSN